MMNKICFEDLFDKQIDFQKMVIEKKGYKEFPVGSKVNLPVDDINLASYHIQALMSEIGEILSADKRWKNYRIDNINMENKKEEIADCFIVLMNIAIFSGFSGKEIAETILSKMEENVGRIA